jgi:hypothetical protein
MKSKAIYRPYYLVRKPGHEPRAAFRKSYGDTEGAREPPFWEEHRLSTHMMNKKSEQNTATTRKRSDVKQ